MNADEIRPDEPLEEARAYPYSHMDCPHCSNEVACEGDVRGEVIECDCGRKFLAI